MRKIIVNHLLGSAERILFDPHARDNCTEPYIKLRRRCETLGYTFEDSGNQPLQHCRWILFWDAWSVGLETPYEKFLHKIKSRTHGGPSRDLHREAVRAGLQDRLALLMFEPPTVCPRNFDVALHDDFAVIFTWDPMLVNDAKYKRIYLPSPTNYPSVTPLPFHEKKLLVDISSYKFSSHKRALFTERRNTIRFFEEHYADQFDLYGEGWNASLRQSLFRMMRSGRFRREFYRSYQGRVRHKWEVYPRYRFALCYENTIGQPGYVSLKIFDSLRCGVVPVYLGAPDIAGYVDPEAFVDRRQFQSNHELGSFLAGMTEREYRRYVEAGREYVHSAQFRLFQSEHFVETIVHGLQLSR